MHDFDIVKLQDLNAGLEKHALELQSLVSEATLKYFKPLDELVAAVTKVMMEDSEDLSTTELERIVIKIPVMLYSLSGKVEFAGIKQDVARLVEKARYNKVAANYKGTVLERQAAAALESRQEELYYIASNRIFKELEKKITAAYELLASAKKIISFRIASFDVTRSDNND